MPPPSKTRVAILGCGIIGPVHGDAIRTLPEAELVAVADVDPDAARRMGERYGVPWYSDVQAMLDAEDIDIVTVCTPSGMHGQHAMQIMRAGRHVIVEKPLEITRDRLDALQRAAEETGRTVSVISQHRFDPASRRVHESITAGRLGRPVLGVAQIAWWRSQEYYDSGAWRGTHALDGGGILMNQSIHTIDLLLWCMGPVATVSAYTGTLAHQMETEDTAVASLRFRSGALGTIVASSAAYPGVTTRLEIFGDRGSAIIERDHLAYLEMHEEGEEIPTWGHEGRATEPPQVGGEPSNTHAAQIADVIAAIREGRAPAIGVEDGRRAVELILAIYESSRTGREISL